MTWFITGFGNYINKAFFIPDTRVPIPDTLVLCTVFSQVHSAGEGSEGEGDIPAVTLQQCGKTAPGAVPAAIFRIES